MMYTGKQLRALVMPLMFEQFLNSIIPYVQKARADKMRPYLQQNAGGTL